MNHKLTKIIPFGVLVEPNGHQANFSALDISDLRSLFDQHQLIVLRGFESFPLVEDFVKFCDRFGEISVWPFGKVLELVEDADPQDHIFDNNYVPLHWDGMYRPQIPEYQIFHCVSAPGPGQGGRTTFSNTITALETASVELKNLWSKVVGVYERKMQFYNSKTISPIITAHPVKAITVLRYNEPPTEENGKFLNPPQLKFEGLSDGAQESFHRSLKDVLYSPKNFYAHEWKTGDVVIADNLSLLHGREKFVSRAPRHLRRVHVLSDPPFANPGLESYQ